MMERRETFNDRSERFDSEKMAAKTDAEREALMEQFDSERRTYRLEEEASGRRSPGINILGKQVMWSDWVDIAVHHAVAANEALIGGSGAAALAAEFRAALVAVTASTHAIEAIYAELKYLVPSQKCDARGNRLNQFKTVRNTLVIAFGLQDRDGQRLSSSFATLFGRRNFAVHPYAELVPLVAHPSGVMSSAELAKFDAKTSIDSAACALDVLALAAEPPQPYNRWVERWVEAYEPSLRRMVGDLRPLIA